MSIRFFESGDIGVDSGQLGTMVTFTTVTTNFSIVPGVDVVGLTKYYSIYNITPTVNNISVTMPSPADVPVGWNCKLAILINNTPPFTVGGFNIVTILDSLGATIYRFNGVPNNGTSSTLPQSPLINTATFILRDSTPTWIVHPDIPANMRLGYSLIYRTDYPLPFQNTLIARSCRRMAATVADYDVLFASAITIQFVPTSTVVANINMTLDPICFSAPFSIQSVFLRSGLHSIHFNFSLTTSLATAANLQLVLRLNSVSDIPSAVSYADINGIATFQVRAIAYFAASDILTILGYKTVTGGATTTANNNSCLWIEYLGS